VKEFKARRKSRRHRKKKKKKKKKHRERVERMEAKNVPAHVLMKFPWMKFKPDNVEVDYIGELRLVHPNLDFDFKELGIIDSQAQLEDEFDIIGKQRISKFDSIAEHIKHRLILYGQLNTRKVTKKTGALKKKKSKLTKGDLDFYDVDDEFIDDGDADNNQQAQFEIFEEDFHSFSGPLQTFIQSDLYKKRVKELTHLDRDLRQKEKRERIRDRQQRIEKNKRIREKKAIDDIREKESPLRGLGAPAPFEAEIVEEDEEMERELLQEARRFKQKMAPKTHA
jgi:hypothetical protein